MGAFDKIEKTVENAVENVFSRAFKSEVKPVELASAIKRSMDERSAEISRDRIVSPNEFTLTLSSHDFQKISEWDEEALRDELIAIATSYAREQTYVFLGPVSITFTESSTQPRGKIEVSCHTRRGSVAPATTPHASPQNPIIEVNGERYILTGAVTVIGRGSVADIQLDDSGISRTHLELRVTPSGVIATDLNSTNGSFVEGHKISAATLVDGNTITIGHTRIMFWTSPEPL
ncbi:FhaA domain-containing protein [Arcanobacterium pinnipediorum]|uniref:DUF3662 domain-containing protein n=1 Tax=Arcanobacterium pinnipediorum TaxID=1503041 RepID=A0ABY5AI05_9ACTO|nr:DUF3662 and FHA domain-containing protein [Arcanobacterium pinnipediorum]USR79485.1 DUF3662 domain-containing protein [Arcanobacterium pinnipediorum]